MLIEGELEVKTRFSQSQIAKGKPSRGAVAIYKDKSGAVTFVLYNNKYKTGFKYRIRNNINKVFSRFIENGKISVSFKEPQHDVAVSKANPSDLKKLIHAMKLGCRGEEMSDIDFNKPNDVKRLLDDGKQELKITSKEEYPPKKKISPALTKLVIGNCGLIQLDSRFLELKNLSVLDLRNNQLMNLPEGFGALVNIKELYLAGNRFNFIPNIVFNSDMGLSLRLLDISSNNIKKIPTEIGSLYHLVNLKIDNNKIGALPGTVGMLRSLRYLNVSNNYLEHLPFELSRLTLQSLDISGNYLKAGLGKSIYGSELASVPSLLEVTARKIKDFRFNYSKESLPTTLIEYLEFATYCLCGKSCFHSFAKCTMMLDLGKIAHTVIADTSNGGRMGAPAVGHLCSRHCVNQWQRMPHGAELR